MKKTISKLIIYLLVIMSLTACVNTNTGELNELRQQIDSLEAKISELEKTENSVEELISVKETTSNSPEMSESSANSNQPIAEYLDSQVNSDNPTNWLEIAQCDFATEAHLLAVAKKCATLNYYNTYQEDKEKQVEITNALSQNLATTDAVMTELVDSRYPEVWEAVACSNKSGENTLLEVAKKCANLNCYISNLKNKEKQLEITNALSQNLATTDMVMLELVTSKYPEIWEAVACSNKSGEKALLEVAKKCATLDYYTTYQKDKEKQVEITNALSENSATTNAVMTELVNSRYPEVWEAVACSNKSGEKALLEVAKKCATLDYYTTYQKDKEKQIEITNALSENPATTYAVMLELVASKYPEVVSIAHQWIEP